MPLDKGYSSRQKLILIVSKNKTKKQATLMQYAAPCAFSLALQIIFLCLLY